MLGVAQFIHRLLDGGHTCGVERRGRADPVAFNAHLQAALAGNGLQLQSQVALHGFDGFIAVVTQVDRKAQQTRNGVARGLGNRQLAHRGQPFGCEVRCQLLDRLDHPPRAIQGILAQEHRCRTRVGRHAFDRDVQPANRLPAADDTYGLGVVFKDRTLLNMRFEIGIHRAT
ncbi:hypothetical protein D3C76_1068770 [compost metagenome]